MRADPSKKNLLGAHAPNYERIMKGGCFLGISPLAFNFQEACRILAGEEYGGCRISKYGGCLISKYGPRLKIKCEQAVPRKHLGGLAKTRHRGPGVGNAWARCKHTG